MIIKIIQEISIHLFQINLLVNCQTFQQKNVTFSKTCNAEFPYIEIWFTDQNSKPLELEEKINITLVINYRVYMKNDTLFN